MADIENIRRCGKCERDLPASAFARGTQWCRECESVRMADYRARNAERIVAQKKTWYWRNVEKQRQAAKQWAADNPERARANKARHYAENAGRIREQAKQRARARRATDPDQIRAYDREYNRRRRLDPAQRERDHEINRRWRTKYPEKHAAKEQRRRARKRSAPGGDYTIEDISRIRKAQRDRCAICGKRLRGKGHVDHIQPLAKGGSNEAKNIQLLCADCNFRKSAADPIEHMKSLGRLL